MTAISNEVHPVDLSAPDEIREEVGYAWYEYENGATSLHPYDGETIPHFVLGPGTKGTSTNIRAA